jgi:hypothetical protein
MEGCDFWEDEFIEFVELTIEIFSTEACPEITSNNAIRVEHRDDMECEVTT